MLQLSRAANILLHPIAELPQSMYPLILVADVCSAGLSWSHALLLETLGPELLEPSHACHSWYSAVYLGTLDLLHIRAFVLLYVPTRVVSHPWQLQASTQQRCCLCLLYRFKTDAVLHFQGSREPAKTVATLCGWSRCSALCPMELKPWLSYSHTPGQTARATHLSRTGLSYSQRHWSHLLLQEVESLLCCSPSQATNPEWHLAMTTFSAQLPLCSIILASRIAHVMPHSLQLLVSLYQDLRLKLCPCPQALHFCSTFFLPQNPSSAAQWAPGSEPVGWTHMSRLKYCNSFLQGLELLCLGS